MCVMISQYKISSKNSHLLSQNVFVQSIIYQSEKTIIHWNKQHFAIGKSHVLPTKLPFFLHHVSTINYYYWSIGHCLLLLLFFNLILHYFCFCSFLIYFKKSVHGPGPWQGVHGPSQWKWSMDPVQSGSMCCPHLF